MTKEPASGNNRFMSRRTLMAGALGTTAAIPGTVMAYQVPAAEATVEPKTDDEKIAYHAKEIISLLNKTKPEGMKAFDQAFIVNGVVGAMAFPPGYARGQPYADYSQSGEGWKMKGGAA